MKQNALGSKFKFYSLKNNSKSLSSTIEIYFHFIRSIILPIIQITTLNNNDYSFKIINFLIKKIFYSNYFNKLKLFGENSGTIDILKENISSNYNYGYIRSHHIINFKLIWKKSLITTLFKQTNIQTIRLLLF